MTSSSTRVISITRDSHPVRILITLRLQRSSRSLTLLLGELPKNWRVLKSSAIRVHPKEKEALIGESTRLKSPNSLSKRALVPTDYPNRVIRLSEITFKSRSTITSQVIRERSQTRDKMQQTKRSRRER